MADATCNICLEQLKMPVVIPCGHVHCEKCLTTHIQTGKDAIHSHYPTCRTMFNIATPDWRYVPKKYHEFMIPSVRRVYIEIPPKTGLKNQIALLESRIKSLEKDKLLLMTKCESNMAASATHAEGEKKARLDAEKAKREVVDLKRTYDTLKGKYSDLKSRDTGEGTFNSQPTSQSLDFEDRSMHSRPKRLLPSRAKRSIRVFGSTLSRDDSLAFDPPPMVRKRARRSAPEYLEGTPPRETSDTAVMAQLHASNEDSANIQRGQD